MSRGLVNQRPFSRKRHKQSFKKMLNRAGISIPEFTVNPILKNILSRGALSIIVILLSIFLLVKSLFFQQGQKITQVKFSEDTLATYQDIELLNEVVNQVRGQDYFVLSYNKNNILNNIQKKFPFVGAIQFQLEKPIQDENSDENINLITIGIQLPVELPIQLPISDSQKIQSIFPMKSSLIETEQGGILGVQLLYYDPRILVKLNGKTYAVWDENTYVEIKEGMLLGIRDSDEEPLFTVDTPIYLSGTNSLNGFFFEINLQNFIDIASLANETFPDMKRLVYLAGSTRFAIFTADEKTLYFNFPAGGNIKEQWDLQISKYNILKEKYNNFKNVRTIDLGSLEGNKTIVKKY